MEKISSKLLKGPLLNTVSPIVEWDRKVSSFFRSIHVKIIFWALLPCLCIMGIITLLSLVTIKNTALDVVKERDEAFTQFAANRLAENMQKYTLFLNGLAELKEFKERDHQRMDYALKQSTNWMHVFDRGVWLFDQAGELSWTYPARKIDLWSSFPDSLGFETIKSTLRPYFSNILENDSQKRGFIVIAVSILDNNNDFIGVLAGFCSIPKSTLGTTYSKVLEYELGKSSYAILIDGNNNVLYHRRSSQIGTKIQDQEIIKKLMTKKESGAEATYSATGEMVISSFAPVPGTPWRIVSQGNWSAIEVLIRNYTHLSLVIIWGGGLISALIVFYIIQKLLEPVKALTKGAEQIASGNFEEVPVKRSNDEIETLSLQFNAMVREVKALFAARQKRLEQIDQARLALSRSEEMIRGITNAVNDVIFLVDSHGNIHWVNEKGKKLLDDYKEKDNIFKVLYGSIEAPEECFLKAYFDTHKANDAEIEIKVDGNYLHYWCTASAVHWDHVGEEEKAVVVCRNLTEKKQLREEVLRNAQLAALGELAAGIAHEINNPINGIINYSQIVADVWSKENNPHAELPEKIIKEGGRIAVIVSNLLSFARADTKIKEAVAVSDVINDALDLLGVMLRKEGIEVVVDIDSELSLCRAVVHQLLQIMLNILGNARYALNQKYTLDHPDKMIVIRCKDVKYEGKSMVRTIFRDHGTGIAKDNLEKVCNPFYSTKPPAEGTGLGLSISHGIIEEHGGMLEVQSVEGKWTEVRIDLPVWNKGNSTVDV